VLTRDTAVVVRSGGRSDQHLTCKTRDRNPLLTGQTDWCRSQPVCFSAFLMWPVEPNVFGGPSTVVVASVGRQRECSRAWRIRPRVFVGVITLENSSSKSGTTWADWGAARVGRALA